MCSFICLPINDKRTYHDFQLSVHFNCFSDLITILFPIFAPFFFLFASCLHNSTLLLFTIISSYSLHHIHFSKTLFCFKSLPYKRNFVFAWTKFELWVNNIIIIFYYFCLLKARNLHLLFLLSIWFVKILQLVFVWTKKWIFWISALQVLLVEQYPYLSLVVSFPPLFILLTSHCSLFLHFVNLLFSFFLSLLTLPLSCFLFLCLKLLFFFSFLFVPLCLISFMFILNTWSGIG